MIRVGDLYSLVRFLRWEPWANYYCSRAGCNCSSFEYQFGPQMRRCKICKHSPMTHYSYFSKYILNPIKRYGYVGEGRKAMRKLRDEVLKQTVLRRTKEERKADMMLPDRFVTVRMTQLSPAEQDFYDALYSRSQAKFDTYVNKGTILHNYAHIFELLSRLRQACNHPYLVIQDPRKSTDRNHRTTKEDKAGSTQKNRIRYTSNIPSYLKALEFCLHILFFCKFKV